MVDGRRVAQMNDMLSAVIESGTGKAARIKHPVAGKTGTSQEFRDAWFIGYSADYVTGVWLGNDDNRPMKRVTGGGLPAKLWRRIMARAHEDKNIRPLPGIMSPQPAPAATPGISLWQQLVNSLSGDS